MILPHGYRVRPATPADLDSAVEVFAAYDEGVVGTVEPRREFLEEIWTLPFVAMPHDTQLVEHEGTAAAYAHTVWDPSEGGHQFGLGRVVPSHRGRGIGTALLAWMEDRAVLRGRPDGPPIIPRTSIVSLDEPAAALLRGRGYRFVRAGVDMGMVLRGDERTIVPPEGVHFAGFVAGRDEHTLLALHRETFADHWGQFPTTLEAFAQEWWDAPTWQPGLVVLARHDDEPIGFVASIIVSGGGYITSLGVRKSWRGRGIATALMRRTMADLAARGCRDVFLSADEGNTTGATALYANLGMTIRRRTLVYDGPAQRVSGTRSVTSP